MWKSFQSLCRSYPQIAIECPQMALKFMTGKRQKSCHLPQWHWRVPKGQLTQMDTRLQFKAHSRPSICLHIWPIKSQPSNSTSWLPLTHSFGGLWLLHLEVTTSSLFLVPIGNCISAEDIRDWQLTSSPSQMNSAITFYFKKHNGRPSNITLLQKKQKTPTTWSHLCQNHLLVSCRPKVSFTPVNSKYFYITAVQPLKSGNQPQYTTTTPSKFHQWSFQSCTG